jgi:hypothetical protein
MLEKEKMLMEIKTEIAELHNSILTLSAGLWNVSILIDEMLMDDIHHTAYTQDYDRMVDKLNTEAMGNPDTTIEMEHTEMPPIETPMIKARPKPRKETTPEPPQSPVEPDVPETLPPLPPTLPKAPEPKPSIVERLLGKDADQKAKLRAERTAKLEKELAELQKK